MSERREYEMTEADLAALLDASKPVPLIALNAGMPPSPQERANRAWQQLGWKMGFNYLTVKPTAGKGQRFFTAEPLTIVKEPIEPPKPKPEPPADPRIVYGARCLWWDSIDKVGNTGPFRRGRLEPNPNGGPLKYVNDGQGPISPGLPCCPHCRGLLLEAENLDAWMKNAPAYEADGHPGYVAMLTWSRGRCFKTAAEQKAAYKAETGIDVP